MALTKQELETLVSKLQDMLNKDSDKSYSKLLETVDTLKTHYDLIKDLDAKGIEDKFEELKAGVDSLREGISRRANNSPFHVPGTEDETFSLWKAAMAIGKNPDKPNFAKYKAEKEGEIMKQAYELAVKAAHTVGTDSSVGYLVPDSVIADVIQAIYTRSVFVNLTGDDGPNTLVTVLDGINGDSAKLPKFNGGMIAYWLGEESAYMESAISTGDISLNAKKLGVLARLTEETNKFAGFGFETMFRRDMERAMAKKLDWAIAFGSGGANMPRGITSTDGVRIYQAEDGTVHTSLAAARAVSDWQGKDLDFDMLMNMDLAFEEDDVDLQDSQWISSPRTFAYLKQKKVDHYSAQATNQAYLLSKPIVTNDELASLIGPFGKSTQISSSNLPGAVIGGTTTDTLPDDGKFSTIFRGDFSEVLLARWGGLDFDTDDGKGLGFGTGHTYVRMRLFCDVAVRQERALMFSPDIKVRA